MWVYVQSNGALYAPSGDKFGVGYSGRGEGLNKPTMAHVVNVGPIPAGKWSVGAATSDIGPVSMPLSPMPDTETFGRSGFFIHGDSKEHPGMNMASEGCIVLSYAIRVQIAYSADRFLLVVE